MPLCGLCGTSYPDSDADSGAHERSDKHQLAGARLSLAIAAGAFFGPPSCPWCRSRRGLALLKACRHKAAHAERLAECRRLVAAAAEVTR